MTAFNVQKFTEAVQTFISEQKIDKNHDGYINERNGELSELLKGQNTDDVSTLMMDTVHLSSTSSASAPKKVVGPILEKLQKSIEYYDGLSKTERAQISTKVLSESLDKIYALDGKVDEIADDYKEDLFIEDIEKIIEPLYNTVAGNTTRALPNPPAKEILEAVMTNFETKYTQLGEMNQEIEIQMNTYQGYSNGLLPMVTIEMPNLDEIAGKMGYENYGVFKDSLNNDNQSFNKVIEFAMYLQNDLSQKSTQAISDAHDKVNDFHHSFDDNYPTIVALEDIGFNQEGLQKFAEIPDNALKNTFLEVTYTEAMNSISGMDSPEADKQQKKGPRKYLQGAKLIIENMNKQYNAGGVQQ